MSNSQLSKLKLPKTRLYKIGKSRGFLDRFLGPLLKTALFLIGNVLKRLGKSVIISLGLTAAAAAAGAAVHKKNLDLVIQHQ